MYLLEDLVRMATANQTKINLKWVPARPANYQFLTLRERLRDAWAVFQGKADAVKWPENQ
jgi:hypothetical protein